MKVFCIILAAVALVLPAFGNDDADVQACRNYIAAHSGQSGVNIAAVYQRLGRLYFKQGKTAPAAECFTEALSRAEEHQIPVIALDYASLLLEKREVRRAEIVLTRALQRLPENSRHSTEIKKTLARCCVCQDRILEATRFYKACGLEAETYKNIAAVYREQGRLGDAEFFAGLSAKNASPQLPIVVVAAGKNAEQSSPVQVIPAKVAVGNPASKPKLNRRYIE
ncbi:MAG: tetratricopeptide repeat protein [Planctomycetaceae bacterium]|jgi:tetratricopeptide (TPR) repeat protein|nr:tetratricopeptide repeat protein [Planctomycetaceae bacterium]